MLIIVIIINNKQIIITVPVIPWTSKIPKIGQVNLDYTGWWSIYVYAFVLYQYLGKDTLVDKQNIAKNMASGPHVFINQAVLVWHIYGTNKSYHWEWEDNDGESFQPCQPQ